MCPLYKLILLIILIMCGANHFFCGIENHVLFFTYGRGLIFWTYIISQKDSHVPSLPWKQFLWGRSYELIFKTSPLLWELIPQYILKRPTHVCFSLTCLVYFMQIPYASNTRSSQGTQVSALTSLKSARMKEKFASTMKDVMKKEVCKGKKFDKVRWFIRFFCKSLSWMSY